MAMFSSPVSPGDLRRFAIFGDGLETAQSDLYRRAARALKAAEIDPVVMSVQGLGGPLLDALVAEDFRAITLVTTREGEVAPGVEVVRAGDRAQARAEAIGRADALLGLPSTLGPVSELYLCWVDARAAGRAMPVGLLNQKKAFEVVRGFIGDVASVGLERTDRMIQFSDSIEDLIARLRTMSAP